MSAANFEKRWHVLSTKPGMERKVAETLEKKKIESYCPFTLNGSSWSERRRTAPAVLFKGMVFAKVSPEAYETLLSVDGVINIIFWLSEPAIVNQEEIDTIRKFIAEYDKVTLEKSRVDLNERVRIVNGPLVMWEGNIVEVRTNTVKIVLPTLGYNLVAEIPTENYDINTYTKMSKAV